MTKTKLKLTIRRETLRVIAGMDLVRVAGGGNAGAQLLDTGNAGTGCVNVHDTGNAGTGCVNA